MITIWIDGDYSDYFFFSNSGSKFKYSLFLPRSIIATNLMYKIKYNYKVLRLFIFIFKAYVICIEAIINFPKFRLYKICETGPNQ